MAINRQQLKEELLNVANTQIRNGVPPADLKNQLSNVVKQRVREEIIGKRREPRKSIKGFAKNFKEDITETVQGLGALGAMMVGGVINTVKEPFQEGTQSWLGGLIKEPEETLTKTGKTLKTVGKAMVDEYKEYRHPLEKLYEDPLDVILDIVSLAALFSGGVGILAGKGVLKEGTVATKVLGSIDDIARPLAKPGRTIGVGAKKVIKKLPLGDDFFNGIKNWSKINKKFNKDELRYLIETRKAFDKLDETMDVLSDAEVNTLIPAAEGLVTPVNPSPEFQKALGITRSLAKDRAIFGKSIGKLTTEQIESRRFKPIARMTGLIDEGQDLSKAQLTALKRQFPDANPIYVQHFFADKPSKFSEYLFDSNVLKEYKPSFLKRFKGKKGFIGEAGEKFSKEQITNVFKREAEQTLKWKNNVRFIKEFTELGEKQGFLKAYKMGDNVLPGHEIFAPDGLLRFYGGKIDYVDELVKQASKKSTRSVDEISTIFKDAVDNVFPNSEEALKQLTKKYVGVTKKGVKLYQVPKNIAKQLTKNVKPSNPLVKILWDKPIDAFRFAVLGLTPRWQINNIVGNTMFSTMTGDIFKLNKKKYLKVLNEGLIPDEVFSGMFRAERSTSGSLGIAADTLNSWGETISKNNPMLKKMIVKSDDVISAISKPIKKVGDASFRANQVVDDFFRGTHFINEAEKLARKKFLKSTVKSFDDGLDLLRKAVDDPKIVKEATESVNKWFYGMTNLTPIEKNLVRKVIPFYSWMRWITEYSLRLPLEAPARANLLRNIGKATYNFTEQDKLPEFLRGSMPVGTAPNGSVWYLRSSGANPFSSVNDLLTYGALGTAFQSSAPQISTIYEYITGRNSFPLAQGKKFTREDIVESIASGRLYQFDPVKNRIEEVDETIRPGMIELALRNFVPHYVLLEEVLTGGRRRYTAEGLDTILRDLFVPEEERKAVVKDAVTLQSETDVNRLITKFTSLGGVPMYEWTPELQNARAEELQRATARIFNKDNPLFNESFNNNLRDFVIKELQEGTSKEELQQKLKGLMKRQVKKAKSLK